MPMRWLDIELSNSFAWSPLWYACRNSIVDYRTINTKAIDDASNLFERNFMSEQSVQEFLLSQRMNALNPSPMSDFRSRARQYALLALTTYGQLDPSSLFETVADNAYWVHLPSMELDGALFKLFGAHHIVEAHAISPIGAMAAVATPGVQSYLGLGLMGPIGQHCREEALNFVECLRTSGGLDGEFSANFISQNAEDVADAALLAYHPDFVLANIPAYRAFVPDVYGPPAATPPATNRPPSDRR